MKSIGVHAEQGERGAALLFAVLSVFTAAAMVSMMLTVSLSADRRASVEVGSTRADYLAEGALEIAKQQIQTAVANWQTVPTEGSTEIDGATVNYTITPTGFDAVVPDASGVQSYVTGYNISATAEVEGHVSQLNRIINTQATPIFQFAVFYNNDLEMLPGPNMTLRGRVHSNADIYLGSNNTLTVDTNYLRAIGNIYRCRKNDPNESIGTVNIRKWVKNPFNAGEPSQYFTMKSKSQMSASGVTTTSGYDSAFTAGYDLAGDGSFYDLNDWLPFSVGSMEYWSEPTGYTDGSGSTVMTGQNGITKAQVPDIGSVGMYEETAGGSWSWDAGTGSYVDVGAGNGTHAKGYFHAQADLAILAQNDGSWKAFDKAGTDVTAALKAIDANIVVQKSIYDKKQAGASTSKVKVYEVNMAKLNASGKFPANGLLYMSNYDQGTGLQSAGFKLKNGSELAGKLTVVSDGPVYVQGDYNKTNKKGAAIIADTVNLLSNAWNDTKTNAALPTATATTYNFAMIAGNNPTMGAGKYNGGLENLPIFHEKWSGVECRISGSFVNAWYAKYGTGQWSIGGTYYEAPNRNWTYDTAFNNVANLPPFTPMVVEAADVVSW